MPIRQEAHRAAPSHALRDVTADRDQLSVDDLRVTPQDDDHVVVTYEVFADPADPSSSGTYYWALVREGDEWKLDNFGMSTDFEMEDAFQPGL